MGRNQRQRVCSFIQSVTWWHQLDIRCCLVKFARVAAPGAKSAIYVCILFQKRSFRDCRNKFYTLYMPRLSSNVVRARRKQTQTETCNNISSVTYHQSLTSPQNQQWSNNSDKKAHRHLVTPHSS